MGRPRKRWEHEINDFLKPEATKDNEIKNNDTWIKASKNRERWQEMEREYAIAAAYTNRSTRTRLTLIDSRTDVLRRTYLACGARRAPRRSWSLKERVLENWWARTTRTRESATLFHLNLSLCFQQNPRIPQFVDPVLLQLSSVT